MERTVKKGQMFLIAAIIISVAIVMSRSMIDVYPTAEEKNFQDTETLVEMLENVEQEYRYSINTATRHENVTIVGPEYLRKLSSFIENDTQHEMDYQTIYLFAHLNASTREYNITIGNFLNDEIDATLTIKEAVTFTDHIGYLDSGEDITRGYELSTGYNDKIIIILDYIFRHSTYSENVSLIATRNTNLLFYDIRLRQDSFVRAKDIYVTAVEQINDRSGSGGAGICGDGVCDVGEDCISCEPDCGSCPGDSCGNGVCERELGEGTVTCPEDCGTGGTGSGGKDIDIIAG